MTITNDTAQQTDLSQFSTGGQSFDSSMTDQLMGSKVLDADGDKIGTVAQVYLSEDNQKPLFVTVNTGLFGNRESFVPLTGASFHDEALYVGYDKDTVKNAPNIDADSELVSDEQGSLYDYYDGKGLHDHSDHDGSASGAEMTSSQQQDDDIASGSVGHDTSGPTTDDAMTRSEEQLNVGVQKVETGRAHLKKHIVTEQQSVTIPVSHEEVRIERQPITDSNIDAATDGPALSEEEHEVILTEERPVVDKETVPVERVRLDTDTVTDQQQVTEDVKKEEIEIDNGGGQR